MKFTEKVYTGVKEILATKNYEAIGVMVKEGEKLGAGAIVGGDGGVGVINGGATEVIGVNTALLGGGAEGVLLYAVDATDGAQVGTMVIRGNINLGNIAEEPVAEALVPLAGRIIFMDGTLTAEVEGDGGL